MSAWKIAFQPQQKGDTIIALNSKPEVGANQSLYQEYLKTYVHVERSDGWRTRTEQPLEIVPLARPYGLEAGAIFTGRIMNGEQPGCQYGKWKSNNFSRKFPEPKIYPPNH